MTEQQATVYIGVVQKLVKSHSMIVLLAASLIAVKLNFRVPDVIGIYKKICVRVEQLTGYKLYNMFCFG